MGEMLGRNGSLSMAEAIAQALSNFTLVLLTVGLMVAAIALLKEPRPWPAVMVAEALLSTFILFSIALNYLLNFVLHVFFSEMTAGYLGWADSPFQLDVGFASLGFAVIGFLAFKGGPEVRLAAILGPAFFLWGAASVHLYHMVTLHNFAPDNAGTIFYTDLLLPVIGFALLWLRTRAEQSAHHSVSWQSPA
jgi:hypothetical protein